MTPRIPFIYCFIVPLCRKTRAMELGSSSPSPKRKGDLAPKHNHACKNPVTQCSSNRWVPGILESTSIFGASPLWRHLRLMSGENLNTGCLALYPTNEKQSLLLNRKTQIRTPRRVSFDGCFRSLHQCSGCVATGLNGAVLNMLVGGKGTQKESTKIEGCPMLRPTQLGCRPNLCTSGIPFTVR